MLQKDRNSVHSLCFHVTPDRQNGENIALPTKEPSQEVTQDGTMQNMKESRVGDIDSKEEETQKDMITKERSKIWL